MKKILIVVLILFGCFLGLILANDFRIKHFPSTLIGHKNYKELFEFCQPQISVDGFPQNVEEWRKNTNYPKVYPLYSSNNLADNKVQKFGLFELLGDNVNYENTTSFRTHFIQDKYNINAELFFNNNNDLMLIEKKFNTFKEFKIIQCNYSNKGKLVEMSYANRDHEYHFNVKGQLVYSIFMTRFGMAYSNVFNDYIIY